MDFPEHPFWDFSIEVHRQAGVHEACLQMQVDHALDVNVLFYCCWRGAAGGGAMGGAELERILATVREWQETVVRPVWQARRRLKPRFGDFPTEFTEPLRQALIQAELHAEHLEQLQIAQAAPFDRVPAADDEETRAADALTNLQSYLSFHFETRALPPAGETVVPDLEHSISVIVGASFPRLDPERLRALVRQHLSSLPTQTGRSL